MSNSIRWEAPPYQHCWTNLYEKDGLTSREETKGKVDSRMILQEWGNEAASIMPHGENTMKVQSPSWPISERKFILDLHSDSFGSQDPRNEPAHSNLQQRTVFTPRLTKGVPEDHNIKTLMKTSESMQAAHQTRLLPPFSALSYGTSQSMS